MAYPTVEQANAMLALGAQYGQPREAKIEHTDSPYGIIWASWPSGIITGYGLDDRNIFIRPDGTRLSWDLLPPKVS